MRSLRGSIFAIKRQNLWLWGAGVLSALLTSLVVLIDPIANIFGMVALGGKEFIISIALGFTIIPLVELVKLITRITKK
jgi:Ca2+-transporting ATPase